ncbi:chromosome segregation protein SMC [Pyrinomonas methylaliphatogenes]|uniref:Chromosome partition protein Smc n=1 Tax=Pyrinomonas methylaliphatogenes TaxID=454194 RepID=A0A0B6WY26_9BACT|nr:chromosome segregation protein SMC [Pyrinomonas methylaliphatogenes]CDM65612.1 condensin subunit Smc [Pyrinomonas methylaliphatogenes]
MFKIRRLEITGFKSFADHTEIVFTDDGITAIVGPNGCGKSNIAEAIAWVLGEQRAKSLRGGEMKDVIFQGTRSRPPSGMAEVVLHLVRDERATDGDEISEIDEALAEIDERTQSSLVGENSPDPADPQMMEPGAAEAAQKEDGERRPRHWRPRRFALEFAPGESVTIARRLYRSGESEYLLNGRPVRLRDIQDLFSGTGLAGTHYAIIEQGRIGQILSAKPMERRALIEEAAGITKFRVRQRAAEARLETARANLARVSDIIAEIERQVNSLRRQAAKARRYEQARAELREHLRRVYSADFRSLSEALRGLNEQLHVADLEAQELSGELARVEAEAQRATAQARACEEELAALRAKIAEAELQHDRCARERAYQEEQITALERRSAELEAEIEALRSRLAEVEAERLALAQDEEQVRATSEELTAALAEAERAYAASMNEVAAAEARIEAARADLLTHTAVAERLFEIGRQLEASLERLAQQAEGLIHEQARASAAHLAAKSEAEKVEREVAAAKGRLGELRAEREEVARSLAEARALAHEAATRTRDLRERHARVQHRLDTLTELDARRALYSETVQRIFASDQARREFHFIGTLADALRVEPQWEQAVEAVLGPYLQAVIVPTPEDAVRASKWLRENDAGRALFLVAGLRGASLEGDEAASATVVAETLGLGALLGVSPELRATLERALAREMQTRIADDIEQAVALSLETQAPYVTPEGDWVCGGTLLSAGVERQTGESLLAFKREMRELEARAARLSEEVKAAELAEREAQVRVGELEEKSKQLDEAIGRAERELVALEMNAAQWAQEIARTERHMRVVADDLERLLEERRDLEARRTKTARDAEAAEQARARAAQEVAAATDELAAVRRVAEEENARLSERRAVVAAVGERRRALSADLRRRENEIADLRARLERHDGELAEAQAKLEALRRSVLDLAQSVETIERERAAHARAVEEAGEKLAAARAHADRLTASLAELNRKAAAARDARAALEVQRAEVAARLNYLRESCVAELGQSLEEISAVEIEDGFDLEVARARVEELRARLENFGAVNMMALEELSEAEARLQFLTSQRQDILDGIASTEEALREIRRRSRERFREAFAEINRHFGELFVELFGGGHGEMNLIDADDPLESGIDIIAQPPGKRLQNVLLLSGGEKAMVALALLLAIFRYRPSPFCLLDEVDAPLDEANIGRFTEKIVEMSADTQFIVITHNKRTMEAARALYGVTMEEAGVSKVVSVRFA